MLPIRSHLSIATAGLVLVVPVVLGVMVGGFVAGVVSVAAGFFVYDLFFIPPFFTLTVGTARDWTVLAVYVVVMVLVARVVAVLSEARADSNARAANARRLFEVSELLVANKPVPELGQTVVDEMRSSFGLRGVALALASEGRLEVVASSGEPVRAEELAQLGSGTAVPVSLSTSSSRASSGDEVRVLALSTLDHPVGLLVLRGVPENPALGELLPTLANQFAVALERAELQRRALHYEVLEEVDRLRRALLGAVSHDLRTPLATIKVASSTLLDPTNVLSGPDVVELHQLIDVQTDRLNRLVTNLLDMTRLEAGVLEITKVPNSVLDLIGEALAAIRPSLGDRRVDVDFPDDLPAVQADHLLIGQVLTNLLDNADRYGPPGTAIAVSAERQGGNVAISVSDEGKGVPKDEREAIFESFVRFDTGGRAGLGLALSRTFVEAHGGRIWVEGGPGGGARFVFTLPLAPTGSRV